MSQYKSYDELAREFTKEELQQHLNMVGRLLITSNLKLLAAESEVRGCQQEVNRLLSEADLYLEALARKNGTV